MTPTAFHWRWDSVRKPPQGGFFIALSIKGANDMSFPGLGFLIVFFGGGLGAALRHGVNLTTARLIGGYFPYATLIENVTGSLVMGLLAAYFAFKTGLPQHLRLFLTTGILGGYTTFSTYSLDVALLYERGELWLAALYALSSVVLAVGGLFVGLALVRYYA